MEYNYVQITEMPAVVVIGSFNYSIFHGRFHFSIGSHTVSKRVWTCLREVEDHAQSPNRQGTRFPMGKN